MLLGAINCKINRIKQGAINYPSKFELENGLKKLSERFFIDFQFIPFLRGVLLPTRSPVFEKTYHTYLSQVEGIDLKRNLKILDVKSAEKGVLIPYFDKEYHVSKDGVVDILDHTPPFDICVVLFKYLLLCPDKISLTKGWVPFREIKSATPGIGFFSHDVQHAVKAHYSGRLTDFKKAALALGGVFANVAV